MGERCTLMLADDGGLGVNELTEGSNPHLRLWSRDASDSTDARWVLSRDINLEKLLQIGSLVNVAGLLVLGFAEGANVIFLNTVAGLFAIELQSERAKKLCDNRHPCRLIPVVSFYTPVPRNSHQDLPLLNATEVVGCLEERGEDEETVDRAQQMFDNGSSPIEEGTSSTPSSRVCQAASHVLITGSRPYGGAAPECTDMDVGLLYEDREMTDPLGDVPKRLHD